VFPPVDIIFAPHSWAVSQKRRPHKSLNFQDFFDAGERIATLGKDELANKLKVETQRRTSFSRGKRQLGTMLHIFNYFAVQQKGPARWLAL
jgi:hypothetical protein